MTIDPDTYELLVALARGELAAAESGSWKNRLAADPLLAAEYARITRLLEVLGEGMLPEPPQAAVNRAKSLVPLDETSTADALRPRVSLLARLIFDSRMGPAVGFRGVTAGFHLRYASDVGDVDVQVLPGAAPDTRRVLGQVERDDTPTAAKLVSRDGRVLTNVAIDDAGMFSFEVPFGAYELLLSVSGHSLRIPMDLQ